MHPAVGSIEFNGINISKLPPTKIVRLGIAHVPEGRQLFPEMTVSENLELGSICCKDPSKVRSNLKLVYELFPLLKERSTHDAGCLSGGQQQMLAVGRGLMSGAQLLLLDEPSMGLAPVMVDTLFETISRLSQIGFTILLVEQNVYAALSVAQRVHVIATGQIIFSGTPAQILASEKLREAYLGEVPQG